MSRLARIVALLLLLPASVMASISAPDSSVNVSPDGRLLLIMLSDDPQYDGVRTASLPDGRVVTLRTTFAKSGVYDAVTLAPQWQVDWFAHDWNLQWSSDFRYVARINRFAFEKGWALEFYDRGKPIRRYLLSQLLSGATNIEFFRFTSGDWHTVWYGDDFSRNAEGTQLHLSTARRSVRYYGPSLDLDLDLDGQEFYTFDLASGEIIQRRKSGAWRVWVYSGAAIAISFSLLAGAFFILRALWRRWKRSRQGRGFEIVARAYGDAVAGSISTAKT